MNLSCGSRTIKYLIFTFNFFFVITGIILIAVGASIHAYYTEYNFFLNSQYFSLPNLLIATGSLIFIICFLGCYGAIKNSWIMLVAFSVLLGIIFIFEFSAGIAGYVLRDTTATYLESSMVEKMKNYNDDQSTSARMWDIIQREYECCGVTGMEDWKKVMNDTYDLPISCCPMKNGQTANFFCNSAPMNGTTQSPVTTVVTTVSPTAAPTAAPTTTPTTATATTTIATSPKPSDERRKREAVTLKVDSTTPPYSIGCETAFGKWVKAHAVDIGAVCFTLAVLQLIGIGFSCHLSKQLKNSYYST